MSDDTPTDNQPETPEESFANLRKQKEALEKELAAARPRLVNETIRELGFQPDSERGKILVELMGGDPDAEKAKGYVEKFGWEDGDDGGAAVAASTPPQPPTPSPAEQAALAAAQRTQGIQAVGQPQTPLSLDQQIQQANADLAAATDAHDLTGRKQAGERLNWLNAQKLVEEMERKRK